jgi:starch synthase
MSRKLRRSVTPTTQSKIRALWLCPEIAPFFSSPLAEEISALARWMRSFDIEPTLVVPRWREINPADLNFAKRLLQVEVNFPAKKHTAEVWEGRLPNGPRVFFLEHPELFATSSPSEQAADAPGKWSFLLQGAFDLAQKLAIQPELIHCHGWQTALAPYLLRKQKDAPKTLCTLYDARQHGSFSKQWVDWLGIGWDGFHLGGFEFYDQISFLKAGIAYANHLTTPSPAYTKEIQAVGGAGGLEGILGYRGENVRGICHGIDYDLWNPQSDNSIAQPFSTQDFNGRRRCKAEIQRIFRLPVREGRPIIALLANATPGSGLSDILEVVEQAITMGFQVVSALDGQDTPLREAVIQLAHQHPDTVGVSLDNTEKLHRKLFAGADFFIAPEVYVPSATSLMRAMHYGAVPIARSVGNHNDLIEDGSNGFLFSSEEGSLVSALQKAHRAYGESRSFRQIQQRGMSRDVSWQKTAAQYRELYYTILGRELPSIKDEATAALSFVEKLANQRSNDV